MKPDLLLLHGFAGGPGDWDGILPSLSKVANPMAIQLPGHGDTPVPGNDYSLERAADEIIETYRTQLNQPVLVGYSMGGRIALHAALKAPNVFSGLVLESTTYGIKTQAERDERVNQDGRLADLLINEGITAFVNRWESLPLFESQRRLPRHVQKSVRATRLSHRPEGLAAVLKTLGTGTQQNLLPRLANLRVRTLIIAGELDHKFVAIAQEMGAVLPEATVNIQSGAGHNVHLEKPDEYVRLLIDFLKDRTIERGFRR